MEGSSRLTICDQFLGEPNDRDGKEGADNHGDDAADERDEVCSGMGVVCYNFGHMVAHLYTLLGPNDAKEYPGPNEHNKDAKKPKKVKEVDARLRTGGEFRLFNMFI